MGPESRYFSNGRGHTGFATFRRSAFDVDDARTEVHANHGSSLPGRRGSIVVVSMPYLRLAQLAHGDGSL